MIVMRHWNRLSRETVDYSSLELLQVRFDGALINLVWYLASLPMGWGLEVDDL